jgi:uncharacterized protein
VVGVYFVDTFFWVALAHPRDAFHKHALAWRSSNSASRLVTTEEVLAEVLTWFSGLGATGRLSAVDLVADVQADPRIQVLSQTSAGFKEAVAFFASRPDKDYSFVDCRSMVAMRTLGLSEVLTNDHHFTQEGFTIVFP